MFDFSNAPTEQFGDTGLIPNGTLAKAILHIRAGQHSIEVPSKSNPENFFLDCELTILEGPYARRKVWHRIGVRGSESWVNQGRAAIRAALEFGRGASEQNPAGYQINSFADLDGLTVGIKVKIAKGTGGYSDKNEVAQFLSPNPASSTYKDFQALVSGATSAPGSSAAQNVESVSNSTPAPQAAPATNKPAWL